MTDKVKEIVSRLDAAEESKRVKKQLLKDALKECRNKSIELDAALSSETDPDRYNALLKEQTENEGRNVALTRQAALKDQPAISRDEYHDIARDIRAALNQIMDEHAPAIVNALLELATVTNEYMTEAEELEQISRGADRLAGRIAGFESLRIGNIGSRCGANEKLVNAFMYAYCNNSDFRQVNTHGA